MIIKEIFENIIVNEIPVNIITPLPNECVNNFDANIFLSIMDLQKTYKNLFFIEQNGEYDFNVKHDIYFLHEQSNINEIKITKCISLTKNTIFITFHYINSYELHEMIEEYQKMIYNFIKR